MPRLRALEMVCSDVQKARDMACCCALLPKVCACGMTCRLFVLLQVFI